MHNIWIPRPVLLRNLDTDEVLNRASEKPEPGLKAKTDPSGNTVYVGPDTPWTMWKFLSRFILGNAKLGKGELGAQRAKRLKNLFKKKTAPLTYVKVDSEIVEAVKKILENPVPDGAQNASQFEWNNALTCQLTDFMDAWKNAIEKDAEGPPAWYDPDEEFLAPLEADAPHNGETGETGIVIGRPTLS